MPIISNFAQGFTKPVALCFTPLNGNFIVAQQDGRLFSVNKETGQSTQVSSIPGKLTAISFAADGQTFYAIGEQLGLWRDKLEGGRAKRLIRGLVKPSAIAQKSADALYLTEGNSPGRLFTVTFNPLKVEVTARGLRKASAIIVETATGRVLIAEKGGGGRIVIHKEARRPEVLFGGLGTPVDMCWLDDNQQQILVADKSSGRVLMLDATLPDTLPTELFSAIPDLWCVRPYGPNQLLIGSGNDLLIGDYTPVQQYPVMLQINQNELFIGGWVRVPITINDAAISFADLEFKVEPDYSGAMASYSKDNSFDPANPHVMLTAGWLSGEHKLTVYDRPSGSEVGMSTFTVLDTWPHQKWGPSFTTFGSITSGPVGGTWGGADSGDFTVPQNVKVHPALGTRNIGVVLVDTPDQMYSPATAAATITRFQNEIVNGVSIGGQLRSVAAYFNQASNGLFNINLTGIIGPINLTKNWTTYFTNDEDKWVPVPDLDSTIIEQIVRLNREATLAGNPMVMDLSQIESIVFVFASRIAAPDPNVFAWPRASIGKEKGYLIGTKEIPLVIGSFHLPIMRDMGYIYMPDDWAAVNTDGDPRMLHETLAHELGHNLGLDDQYSKDGFTEDANKRIADAKPNASWELMSWERDLPLPSAAHRLMLGWVDKAAVKLYNFGVNGAIVNDPVTLHAAAGGAPPPGKYAAVEVRLEDGKNYYFEYRPSVGTKIVDPNPPEASAVIGTEAAFRNTIVKVRPDILLVQEDDDATTEGGSFITGEDFKDEDDTTPGFVREFIMKVTNTTPDTASINITYDPAVRPDPGLTPWSPSTNWQSPDLVVTNFRSMIDPAYRNIPWPGHDNTLVAKVTNRGSSPASGVTVKFYSKDFTFGHGEEQPLGEQTQDIPVGATVTFASPKAWRPSQLQFPFGTMYYQQHACLVARVEPFLDPITNIWEVTPENNEAQSNYSWLASTTSSPASREITVVNVENPFDRAARISFSVHQPNPLFRVYLDHRWVYLEPGERQQILVMMESCLGDDRFSHLHQNYRHNERRITTNIRLSALGDTGETCTASVIGGVSIMAETGSGTHFELFEAQGGRADGLVVTTDTGLGVEGKVMVTILPADVENDSPEMMREADLEGGRFWVELGGVREVRVQAHYIGRFPWAPCESSVIVL